MRYIIFAKETCFYCIQTQKLLDDREKKYKIINFSAEQEGILNEIKNVCDWKTVPMVFCREGNNIQFIGGYTDLVKCLSDVEKD
tara:strand:+ start:630 stop:881 length:252 start_codon:yes stop_codon:yes gene_type:complete